MSKISELLEEYSKLNVVFDSMEDETGMQEIVEAVDTEKVFALDDRIAELENALLEINNKINEIPAGTELNQEQEKLFADRDDLQAQLDAMKAKRERELKEDYNEDDELGLYIQTDGDMYKKYIQPALEDIKAGKEVDWLSIAKIGSGKYFKELGIKLTDEQVESGAEYIQDYFTADLNLDEEKEEIDPSEIYNILVKELPAEDLDHHATDLYVKVSPKSTEIINKMKHKDTNVTTFISNQDKADWYDLAFCYPQGLNESVETIASLLEQYAAIEADIQKAEVKELDVAELEVATVEAPETKELVVETPEETELIELEKAEVEEADVVDPMVAEPEETIINKEEASAENNEDTTEEPEEENTEKDAEEKEAQLNEISEETADAVKEQRQIDSLKADMVANATQDPKDIEVADELADKATKTNELNQKWKKAKGLEESELGE